MRIQLGFLFFDDLQSLLSNQILVVLENLHMMLISEVDNIKRIFVTLYKIISFSLHYYH